MTIDFLKVLYAELKKTQRQGMLKKEGFLYVFVEIIKRVMHTLKCKFFFISQEGNE
ncbi:hypothetical protein JCM21531_3426 [Acetivibrio straminisolvens JCM 21531]|jgi:hypothetical protein|uniref:Uncharacterized protein n=1 Tax=Acetivibrio straminisolvens JCM 21531 TaxID=1294263 RepID=W4V8Z0_9FIRM|nr:hypothetical protein JCM21531_3426 [Acetivibrio straminisolvens JCM 21531]